MTRELLETKTRKELCQLAKRNGIPGWHEMAKSDLVRLLHRKLAQARKTRESARVMVAAPRVAKKEAASRPSVAATATKVNGSRSGAPKTSGSSAETLASKSKKELERLARQSGIAGWHSMRKDEIVAALAKRPSATASAKTAAAAGDEGAGVKPVNRLKKALAASDRRGGAGRKGDSGVGSKNAGSARSQAALPRFLAAPTNGGNRAVTKDRVVALVRDPYWLHVYWELTQAAIKRTEAALGRDWYSAKPVLRLLDVSSEDTTSSSECVIRDVEIHGGVNNWYIDVRNPPRTYRVDIGYKTERGRFFVLARSNSVTTPKPAASDQLDTHWQGVQQDSDRIFARSAGPNAGHENIELRTLFDERLRRPMSTGTLGDYGSGALGNVRRRGFHFQLDAELIVYGSTDPSARVTLLGEPVQVREDGTFTLRFSLPDGRQILPAVAQTYDGIEERTIILAIERNTKELEPMVHDGQD